MALLCLGCGVCSLLYGFSHLALSLEQEPGGGRERQARDPAAPGAWRHVGDGRRAAEGSTGRGEEEAGRYGSRGEAGARAGFGSPSAFLQEGPGRRRSALPVLPPAGGAGLGALSRPMQDPLAPPAARCRPAALWRPLCSGDGSEARLLLGKVLWEGTVVGPSLRAPSRAAPSSRGPVPGKQEAEKALKPNKKPKLRKAVVRASRWPKLVTEHVSVSGEAVRPGGRAPSAGVCAARDGDIKTGGHWSAASGGGCDFTATPC